MSDLIREAEELASAKPKASASLLASCQSHWIAVQLATPDRLAALSAAAWAAEALLAPTKYTRQQCLAASRQWQARVPK
jgi:hypothetical protein